MRVAVEIRVAVGALLTLQVLTSFGAIGLLERMGPAIARILAENLYSLEATEELLAALGEAKVAPDRARDRFAGALERARANVTEPEESPILKRIEAEAPAALSGDERARQETVALVRELSRVNHASTHQADSAARELGHAGAWAAALLGAASFAFSVLVLRRLRRRVVGPLNELSDTAQAYRRGDLHRRTRRVDMSPAFTQVAEVLDELLDETMCPATREAAPGEQPGRLEQGALLALLALDGRERVLLDEAGRVRAASAGALGRLDGSAAGEGLSEALRQVARGEEVEGFRVQRLEGGAICELPPA
ncbi:MAG TPA: hypothetical protein DEA08_31190 [Planctomycetes bacterium]|nr:hypothetical protein [Planctomycetota bacterium]